MFSEERRFRRLSEQFVLVPFYNHIIAIQFYMAMVFGYQKISRRITSINLASLATALENLEA